GCGEGNRKLGGEAGVGAPPGLQRQKKYPPRGGRRRAPALPPRSRCPSVRFVSPGRPQWIMLLGAADEGRVMGRTFLGRQRRRMAAALAIAGSVVALDCSTAAAQDDTVELPGVDVTGTRLGRGPNRAPSRPSPGPRTEAPPPAETPPTDDGTGGGAGAGTSGIVAGTNITGTSTTIITSAEIERSPGMTIQDVLAREP